MSLHGALHTLNGMLLKSEDPTDFLCMLGETNVKKGILFLFVETFATFKHTKCDRILEKNNKKGGELTRQH